MPITNLQNYYNLNIKIKAEASEFRVHIRAIPIIPLWSKNCMTMKVVGVVNIVYQNKTNSVNINQYHIGFRFSVTPTTSLLYVTPNYPSMI